MQLNKKEERAEEKTLNPTDRFYIMLIVWSSLVMFIAGTIVHHFYPNAVSSLFGRLKASIIAIYCYI